MRIFLAVRHSLDPSQYYGSHWSNNLVPAQLRLGHEVVQSGVDLLPASRFLHIGHDFTTEEREIRAGLTESILKELRQQHSREPVDLFLSYFYNAHFEPGGFDDIRLLGIPSVNFYCNSLYQLELADAVSAAADFAWHPERDARDAYLKIGANPVHVQMGGEPTLNYPVPMEEREDSACFVGQRYADRDRWLAALARADVPLAIYGSGWRKVDPALNRPPKHSVESVRGRLQTRPGSAPGYLQYAARRLHSDGPIRATRRLISQVGYRQETRRVMRRLEPHARGRVPEGKLNEVFSGHAIVLNFSNVWADGHPGSSLIPHVRLRDFEAPLCRACYATQYSDEIAELYVPDREIITYTSVEELTDKVRYFLRRPEQAETLREAGYKRVLRDHTWDRRFQELFEKIGVISKTRARAAQS